MRVLRVPETLDVIIEIADDTSEKLELPGVLQLPVQDLVDEFADVHDVQRVARLRVRGTIYLRGT